jgi:hypothetical protein
VLQGGCWRCVRARARAGRGPLPAAVMRLRQPGSAPRGGGGGACTAHTRAPARCATRIHTRAHTRTHAHTHSNTQGPRNRLAPAAPATSPTLPCFRPAPPP